MMRYLVCRIRENAYHPVAVFKSAKDATGYTSLKYGDRLAVIDLKKGVRTDMHKYTAEELMQDGISRDEAERLIMLGRAEEEKVKAVAKRYRKKFAIGEE